MKKAKKLMSFLCAAMLLGVTACNGGGDDKPEYSLTTTTTIDDDIRNPVDVSALVTKDDTLKNPNLVYFIHYDIRIAGDIKPAVKLFEETYGGEINYQQVGWAEKNEKLLTLISTGNSPDLVDKESLAFPYYMSQNMYTDLGSYMEKYMNEEQWTDAYKNLIERFSWNGSKYYYPWTLNALPYCLIYDADRFLSFGLDNPKELYLCDKWDWNSFRQVMIDFMTKNPDAAGGVQCMVSHDILVSTGLPLISIQNGKVINNLNTETIDRAANFLMDLRKQNLPVRGEGMWSNEPEPLATGKVAFIGVGQYMVADFCANYPDQHFEFVPFPRDPLADKYYHNMTDFGYMVPSGSPNPEGAAAFINIMRKIQVDPDIQDVLKKSIMTDKHYDEETYNYIKSFDNVDNYDLVLEGYWGFNSELTKIVENMINNIAFEHGDEQKGWTQLRAEFEGTIDSYLEAYK
ncbi:MAG: extracellular solute-binding protein [Ruminiclostridium sp.]|nr:extracellular solute-binding protein [Ruminiclostridium sp.]